MCRIFYLLKYLKNDLSCAFRDHTLTKDNALNISLLRIFMNLVDVHDHLYNTPEHI